MGYTKQVRPFYSTHRRDGKGPNERRLEAEKCLNLRVLEGWSIFKISQELGLSENTVARRIEAATKSREAVAVDAYREQQNHLLDDLLERHNQQLAAYEAILTTAGVSSASQFAALAGRQQTMQGMLRLAERRARLNGTDAPVKADVRVDATVTAVTAQEREMQQLIEQAERDNKLREAGLAAPSTEDSEATA